MNEQFELEAKLLYSVVVAGKSAKFADTVIRRLLVRCENGEMPLSMLRRLGTEVEIRGACRNAGTGNYTKIGRCFAELAASDLDFTNCTPFDLEKIHGIGPKTARFFVMWVRPDERYAALDVHILRWMGRQGYVVPKSTPSGRVYAELEMAFLAEADKRGMTPRELDSEIWDAGSARKPSPASNQNSVNSAIRSTTF